MSIIDTAGVKTRLHSNGGVAVTYPDGTVVTLDSSGYLRTQYPDQSFSVMSLPLAQSRPTFSHPPGDYISAERTVEEPDKNDSTSSYYLRIFPDGTRIAIKLPDYAPHGRVEAIFPNGAQVNAQGRDMTVTTALGVVLRVQERRNPDEPTSTISSYFEYLSPSAQMATSWPIFSKTAAADASARAALPTQDIESTYPDGTRTILKSDNTPLEILYPDGPDTEVDIYHGRVIVYRDAENKTPDHQDTLGARKAWLNALENEPAAVQTEGERLPDGAVNLTGGGSEREASAADLFATEDIGTLGMIGRSLGVALKDIILVALIIGLLVWVILLQIQVRNIPPRGRGGSHTDNTNKTKADGDKDEDDSQGASEPTAASSGMDNRPQHDDLKENQAEQDKRLADIRAAASEKVIRVGAQDLKSLDSLSSPGCVLRLVEKPGGELILKSYGRTGFQAYPACADGPQTDGKGTVSENNLDSRLIKLCFDIQNGNRSSGVWRNINTVKSALFQQISVSSGTFEVKLFQKGRIVVDA